jgi:hypothetical protein
LAILEATMRALLNSLPDAAASAFFMLGAYAVVRFAFAADMLVSVGP